MNCNPIATHPQRPDAPTDDHEQSPARFFRPAQIRPDPARPRRSSGRCAAGTGARGFRGHGHRHPRGDMGHGRRAHRGGPRPPRSRLERRRTPECRRQHAGDPRRLQRQPAEDHGVLRRHRAGHAPVRAVPCAGTRPFVRHPRSGKAQGRRQRASRFPSRRCRTRRRRQGPAEGRPGGARAAVGEIRRQRARRRERLVASRRRRTRPRRSPRRRDRGRARGGRGGRKERIQADAALALLRPRDAVRRRPGAARADAPGGGHGRLRSRRGAGMGQHRGDRADPRVARCRGAAARLPEFRRAVARAQDGTDAR